MIAVWYDRPVQRSFGSSWRRAWSALGCALALGCGGGLASIEPTPKESGDASAPPTLAALPQLPKEASGRTERTHQGMLLVRATLDAAMPVAPADRSYTALQDWAQSDVARWVAERRDEIEVLRTRMLLEGEASAGERVVSHALIALLHEDTARSLARMPVPSELDADTEVAQMYREVIAAQADAFTSSALRELRQCADTSLTGPKDMAGYGSYCRARFERLRRGIGAAQ